MAEEKFELIKLPCKVGDLIFGLLFVPSTKEYTINLFKVNVIEMYEKDICYNLVVPSVGGRIYEFYSNDWGKYLFHTLSS